MCQRWPLNCDSIEDAKQKAEHDKMMKEAEEKKREVRRQINKLRRQFKAILEQNETMPSNLQLDRLVSILCRYSMTAETGEFLLTNCRNW